jgi:tetratricopeptide (TPR) repeat protein
MHKQRRLPEAERLYKAVLKSDRRHFGALYRLGLVHLHQGQLGDAERSFRRALESDRNSAETYHHLGVVLAGLQRYENAIEHYEKALAIRPGLAETHNNLGHALQWLGRLDEAKEHYEKALAIKPAYAEACNNLGNVLHLLGRFDEAVAQLELAITLNPMYGEAHVNLGNVLAKLGRADEAIKHFREAIAINNRDVEAHSSLALTLNLLERVDEALAHWDQVVAIEPGHVVALVNRGRTLHALGRMDEGIACLEKAVDLSPENPSAYLELAISKRLTERDPHFVGLLKLARNLEALPEKQKIELHFALGKAFGDIGNYEESFWHLLHGNRAKRQQVTYDEQQLMQRLERKLSVFTAELMREKHGVGDPSPVPVFIVGMTRSGTTLIEQILSSHPKVFGAGERFGLGGVAASIPDFPEGVAGLSGEQLRELGGSYLRGIQPLAPGAERITDKMPANFLVAGLIPLVLPNARIIHSCRDPRDTALSCFSTLFATGQEHTYDLGELGRYIRAYQVLMEHWRSVLPRGMMLDVQYEDVVDDLEGSARRIVAHCGLDWDEACLAFYKAQRPVLTAAMRQVRQPMYKSSVGRWRAYEQQLQPLLHALEGA